MKKQLPVILVAVVAVILAAALFAARQRITSLEKTLANQQENPPQAGPQMTGVAESGAETVRSVPKAVAEMPSGIEADDPSDSKPDPETDSTRRIMGDMAKAIEANPTINKMVEAGQRGTIGALYADMIEYLGLNAEETRYFMDLLMYRQMAHVDAHLKMMSGDLTEEEKLALMDKVRLAGETTRSEMEKFLNDSGDFDEFTYYEDTIGERMVLSQMDQMLGEEALDEETYRKVLSIMYDERENYTWQTDLHDQENRDLSAERFSQTNIQKHMEDVRILGEQMDQRMQEVLSPEQLEAWRTSGSAMQSLMEGQLQQAGQLYGEE